MKYTGFILAGGKAKRLNGAEKGLLLVHGKSMIQHAINTLEHCAQSIIILSNNNNYKHLGLPVFEDEVKNCGPLSGICKGLSITTTEWNIFLTSDSPFINKELIQFLLSQTADHQAVIPTYKGKTYPLTAVYHRSCLAVLKNQLDNKHLRVKDVLPLIKTKTIELMDTHPFFNKTSLTNINTFEDYEKHRHYS